MVNTRRTSTVWGVQRQTRPLVAEAGTFAMAEEIGLGPSLDEARLERT